MSAEENAEVVSRAHEYPRRQNDAGRKDKLLQMETKLHDAWWGTEERLPPWPTLIRRFAFGPDDPNRPGSFHVPRPHGRGGKTELCKALAGFLFDSEEHLVRIDMSEVHGEALRGPPDRRRRPATWAEEGGYLAGSRAPQILQRAAARRGGKGPPDVFNVLLQVLDDGRLTDGQSRTVDFKNTVIGDQQHRLALIRSHGGPGLAGHQDDGMGRAEEPLPPSS